MKTKAPTPKPDDRGKNTQGPREKLPIPARPAKMSKGAPTPKNMRVD